MFELRELDDNNDDNNQFNEEVNESEVKYIFKHIFHWISLWNSSMGRDFIHNIESLENGISVIDHILTPKDEEVALIVAENNNNLNNNNRLSVEERVEEVDMMEQEMLGGVVEQQGVVNVQPEGLRNFETLNNEPSVLSSPPHNNATQSQSSGTSSTTTTTTTSPSGCKRDTNMQVTQPTSPLESPLASPLLLHSTSFSLPSSSHQRLHSSSNDGIVNNCSTSATNTADPNWQASKSTVRERNAAMFNNELMADVQFVVGSEPDIQTIPAHKYVLATGSSVFYAMFYGGLAEDNPAILVPDVEPAAFLTLLKYLYCDEIQLEPDNVLATLYVAKKYIVPHLARACVNYLETSLTAKNACLLLSQSRLFEEPDLMQRCWEVIDAQAEMAIKSEGFVEIDLKTFETILNRETLNCKEIDLFEASLNWAHAACLKMDLDPTMENKRKVLGNALYLIRIPTMTLEEFANRVAQLRILTQSETIEIFLNFTAKTKPKLCFPVTPRAGLKTQVCHRFQSCAYRSNQWRYRGRCDSIQFSVDKRIFIIGFGLYGSSTGAADYNVKIELKRLGRVLAESNTKFFSDGSSNTFHVFFEHPIQIESESFYTASVILDGSELSFFGQEGMTEVCMGSVTFQFQCSSESTNGTGVQGGQIPELIFYGPASGVSNTLTRRHTISSVSTGNHETASSSSSISGSNHRTENNFASSNENKADDYLGRPDVLDFGGQSSIQKHCPGKQGVLGMSSVRYCVNFWIKS